MNKLREPGYYRVRFSEGDEIEIAYWNNEFWFFVNIDYAWQDKDFSWIDTTPINLTPRISAEHMVLKLRAHGLAWGQIEIALVDGKTLVDLCKQFGIDTEIKP